VAARKKTEQSDAVAGEFTERDVEVIMDIVHRRTELMHQLKAAILRGDTLTEHELARRVCGLPPDPKQ
jgi:hypothetical protein